MYNVLGGSERGPGLYGTEPWDFYLRNLLLNFNLWFVLALLAGPLLGLGLLTRSQFSSSRFPIRYMVFATPFYLWLAVFSLQPHKEERFMYPAYPFLCLNSAIALHVLLSYIGALHSSKILGRITGQAKLAFVSAFIISAVIAGFFRTFGIMSAYRAPLQIYAPLQRLDPLQRIDRLQRIDLLRQFDHLTSDGIVCLGKEWYRFPSSYFLPDHMRAKFIRSDFDGLLPGEFSEAKVGFGFFPGTWLDPPGMNDRNIPDRGKYVGGSPHLKVPTDSARLISTIALFW